jgi:hypothetical protein
VIDFIRAKVAELADAPDLGSGGETHGGSTPPFRTKLFYQRLAADFASHFLPRCQPPVAPGLQIVAALQECRADRQSQHSLSLILLSVLKNPLLENPKTPVKSMNHSDSCAEPFI